MPNPKEDSKNRHFVEDITPKDSECFEYMCKFCNVSFTANKENDTKDISNHLHSCREYEKYVANQKARDKASDFLRSTRSTTRTPTKEASVASTSASDLLRSTRSTLRTPAKEAPAASTAAAEPLRSTRSTTRTPTKDALAAGMATGATRLQVQQPTLLPRKVIAGKEKSKPTKATKVTGCAAGSSDVVEPEAENKEPNDETIRPEGPVKAGVRCLEEPVDPVGKLGEPHASSAHPLQGQDNEFPGGHTANAVVIGIPQRPQINVVPPSNPQTPTARSSEVNNANLLCFSPQILAGMSPQNLTINIFEGHQQTHNWNIISPTKSPNSRPKVSPVRGAGNKENASPVQCTALTEEATYVGSNNQHRGRTREQTAANPSAKPSVIKVQFDRVDQETINQFVDDVQQRFDDFLMSKQLLSIHMAPAKERAKKTGPTVYITISSYTTSLETIGWIGKLKVYGNLNAEPFLGTISENSIRMHKLLGGVRTATQ